MESVYSYVCTKMKLDPGQGVELSADGIMIEVEKSKQDEKAQILKQIKKAKELVDEADSAEVDGDTSEDWTPSKGVYLCHLFHVCRGGEKICGTCSCIVLCSQRSIQSCWQRERNEAQTLPELQSTAAGSNERQRRSTS